MILYLLGMMVVGVVFCIFLVAELKRLNKEEQKIAKRHDLE